LTEHHCRHWRIGPADIENVPGGALVFLQFLVKHPQLGLDLGLQVRPWSVVDSVLARVCLKEEADRQRHCPCIEAVDAAAHVIFGNIRN
jgi:hypothetical protein